MRLPVQKGEAGEAMAPACGVLLKKDVAANKALRNDYLPKG
jgi:hypothetical protein